LDAVGEIANTEDANGKNDEACATGENERKNQAVNVRKEVALTSAKRYRKRFGKNIFR
jgi:hypothetical protein